MNEELELRKRLQDSDPGINAPSLNESVVARAALSKKRRFTSFKVARLTMAAASLSIVGLAVTSVSLFQPVANEPLFSLAGSSQGAAMRNDASATMESSAIEPGGMSADSMIWPGFSYEYVAGDLSTETGSGKVYQAELEGNPIEIVRNLAEYFGIDQEPTLDEWATPEYPSYSVQLENTSLGIYFSGTGSWYYSSWNPDHYSCTSVTSSQDGEARIDEGCNPKSTPELIPSETDLIQQASGIFEDLGFKVDPASAAAWRSEWGASVTFPNIQNGINTGMDFYAGWDSRGDLNYLAGYSFRLVERGSFDTISAFDAVSRLSDGRWYGSAPSSYYENFAVAYDAPVTSEIAPAEDVAIEEPAVIDEEPGFDIGEPEIKELQIVRSEAVTLSVFDAAGNYWFVPGYLLYNQEGWFDSVISLEEGVIELPEPFDFDVRPAEIEPLG
jgi:hypothetical protein